MSPYDAHIPEEVFTFSSQSAKTNRTSMMMAEPRPAGLDVQYEVAFNIGHSVPEVQGLFTQLEGRILRVWTVVTERDDATYRQVYAKEREIMKSFDGMEFEFNVIPLLGRPIVDAIPDPSCKLVYQR